MDRKKLGALSDRVALVQAGTRWKPRRLVGDQTHLIVRDRRAVQGLGEMEERVFVDRIEGTGGPAPSKRIPGRAVSMGSFLTTYMREDERFVVAAPAPAVVAEPNRPNQVTARIDALETRVRFLEASLGVS